MINRSNKSQKIGKKIFGFNRRIMIYLLTKLYLWYHVENKESTEHAHKGVGNENLHHFRKNLNGSTVQKLTNLLFICTEES